MAPCSGIVRVQSLDGSLHSNIIPPQCGGEA